MNKKGKMIESGIDHLKIVPDPNDVILYFEGGKWYSWACIIELTDDDRDQLIEVLQRLRDAKGSGQPRLKDISHDKLKGVGIKPTPIEHQIAEAKLDNQDKDTSDRWDEEFRKLNENIFSVKIEIANEDSQRSDEDLKNMQEEMKLRKERNSKLRLEVEWLEGPEPVELDTGRGS